ncbi:MULTISPECIES: winged helix-turn-helix transcriptional regulator [unclassified Streptomyces]|uniref:winged helix-turn-helix transcriptional regulator n=1 Tax=unclassified Streptomyces TaxID=2593676 RepID=UPI0036F0A8B4
MGRKGPGLRQVDEFRHGAENTLQPPRQAAGAARLPPFGPLGELDRQIRVGLSRDGRVTATELAQRFGIGDSRAARRLRRLVETGAVMLRCEVSPCAVSRPITATHDPAGQARRTPAGPGGPGAQHGACWPQDPHRPSVALSRAGQGTRRPRARISCKPIRTRGPWIHYGVTLRARRNP